MVSSMGAIVSRGYMDYTVRTVIDNGLYVLYTMHRNC